MKKKPGPKPKVKRGPKPDTLKIEGSWQKAVGKALKKKRPENGWPKN
jgi:hypothetical protein